MVDTLHDLIPLINESVLEALCPSLIDLLRNSVGVSTRLGTSQFLIDLCLRRKQVLASARNICGQLHYWTFFLNSSSRS